MKLKLLTKSEVSKAATLDRQREIQEGMKLAKRVDNLRETVAEEDRSLQEFRSRTLTAIMTEVEAYTTKRNLLEDEVWELEERKRLATEPLTEQELALETLRARLDEIRKEQLQKEVDLQTLERALEERSAEVEEKSAKATELLAEASRERDDVFSDKQHTTRLLRDAQAQADRTASAQASFEEEKANTEKRLKEREDALVDRELQVVKDRKELGSRERQLRDREQLLERNIERYG